MQRKMRCRNAQVPNRVRLSTHARTHTHSTYLDVRRVHVVPYLDQTHPPVCNPFINPNQDISRQQTMCKGNTWANWLKEQNRHNITKNVRVSRTEGECCTVWQTDRSMRANKPPKIKMFAVDKNMLAICANATVI